ncbi:PREDICTED: uncharacterized protein LOC109226132 [Nicotiana attenuata]|uniref:uncharacterized protein LOC109226132 n=1 Tax=Nicotiana attenuata TaxID=49451 RepID=UPI000904A8F2|nr:PREDICTED: uncharacterized protein LOC109226132 [Nicotiana attenuata]
MAIPAYPALDGEGNAQTLEDEEEDFFAPRTFVAAEESDATKSTVEELEQTILIKHLLDRKVYFGTGLTPELRIELIQFLSNNIDCFSWSHLDMTGIPLEITSHILSVDPKFMPVKQKRRPQSEVKHAFVKEEVAKLLKIGSIREVKYPEWLANIVVVPKKGNKLRMGIKINPDKIKAIEEITAVNSVKAVQRLTGRIAALSRFISRSSDKSHHFFALLKRKNNFEWTSECQHALEELKRYLSSPPLLRTPEEGETLYLYLAVSEIAVSGVLVREEQGMQFPIYYVSRTLGDAKTWYPHLEKLALALISASRKLKPYFLCHRICVLTTYPLRSILHMPELSGRLAKWAIQLGGYGIEYQPRTAIKSQILADFVADFSPALIPEVEKELLLKSGTSSGVWTLFTDGATNMRGYEAMIAGLDLAKGLGAEIVEAKCDSLLVVSQVNGSYEAREDTMQRNLDKIQIALRRFKEWNLVHIPREQNCEADALANLGSSAEEEDLLPRPVVQLFKSAVEDGQAEINSASLTWDWRNKYIAYLKDGKLPTDPKESRALRTKAARFSPDENGALYRRTFDGPLAICLGPGNTEYVLREINEGTCGNYSRADSLVQKVIRAGYYWDSMEKDAKEFVRKCDKCKRFAPMIHRPREQLHSILSPWPFIKWGMDIVGPLPTAPESRPK